MKTPARAQSPDFWLLLTVGILTIFGLLILTSASSNASLEKFGDSYYFIKHQLTAGLLPGLCLFFFFYFIDYRHWPKFALPLLTVSVFLLCLVFIPGLGSEYGTARSWINIAGFSLQPSEIVKLTFLLYLANWLAKRGEGVRDFYTGFLPFAVLLSIISVLILKQPDMGTLSIIIFMSMAVFFVSGAKLKHVIMFVATGCAAIYLLIIKSPYRAARLTTFLHPELDPQGIGYHINQAFLALGSGGFWGRGFGQSRQKFQYLPEVSGDSIFAVLGEELGLIGCLALIALYLIILQRAFKIAQKAPDQFGRFLSVGIVSWLLFQAFFNIASMVGIMPMTGVPLPFVSSGGTALAVGLGAVGLLANISKSTTKQ